MQSDSNSSSSSEDNEDEAGASVAVSTSAPAVPKPSAPAVPKTSAPAVPNTSALTVPETSPPPVPVASAQRSRTSDEPSDEVKIQIKKIKEGFSADSTLPLTCVLCSKNNIKSYYAMMNHLKNVHRIKYTHMKDTYVYTIGTQENAQAQVTRRANNKGETTGVKKAVAKAAPKEAPTAMAIPQETATGVVYTGGHPIMVSNEDPDVTWKVLPAWIKCDKDHNPVQPFTTCGPPDLVKNPPNTSQLLSQAAASSAAPRMTGDAPIAAKAASKNVLDMLLSPVNVLATSSNVEDAQALLFKKLVEEMAKMFNNKEVKFEIPKITIPENGIAKTWVAQPEMTEEELAQLTPEEIERVKRKRNQCPIKLSKDERLMKFPEFERYLKELGGQKKVTYQGHILSMIRLWHIIDIPDGNWEHAAIMVALYKDAVMEDLMETDLMSSKFGRSRDLIDAVMHFCDFQKMVHSRKVDDVAVSKLTSFQNEVLRVYKIKGNQFRSWSNNQKKQLDALRIKHIPETHILKQAVKDAMLCLKSLSMKHKALDSKDMCFNDRVEAATAMTGIIHYNSFAGHWLLNMEL